MGEIKRGWVVYLAPDAAIAPLLQPNDVVLYLNQLKTNTLRDFLEARMSVIGSSAEMVVFRNQRKLKMVVELNDKK